MKIKCTATFLDGKEKFYQDDVRTVSDEDGARFVANGWVEDVDGRVATGASASGETSLDIQNAVMGQEARNG